MLGAIIGDIVGSAFEKHNITTTEFQLFSEFSGFTDDTVLTVATADAIMNGIDFATAYRSWYNKYPGVGYGPGFRVWAGNPKAGPYGSIGNGSAMRVSPIGRMFSGMLVVNSVSRASAMVTHNSAEGLCGAYFMAKAVFLLRNGVGKESIQQLACEHGYKLKTVPQFRQTMKHDYTCKGTIPAAVEAFLESEDFESAIRLAVSIGGDSDTIASMAGALAEAHYGVPLWIAEQALLRVPEEIGRVVSMVGHKAI